MKSSWRTKSSPNFFYFVFCFLGRFWKMALEECKSFKTAQKLWGFGGFQWASFGGVLLFGTLLWPRDGVRNSTMSKFRACASIGGGQGLLSFSDNAFPTKYLAWGERSGNSFHQLHDSGVHQLNDEFTLASAPPPKQKCALFGGMYSAEFLKLLVQKKHASLGGNKIKFKPAP